MSSTYQHEELPVGRIIRLLRLLQGASDEQIQIELFPIALEHAPPYEAISYCWGNANDIQEIICCGQTMYITRSLCAGLQCFRDSKNARILWADAICIDQSDNDEKGIQVNMMGAVYDQASRVLVWLGIAAEEDARMAFNLIQRINGYFESRIVEGELLHNPTRALLNVRRLEDQRQLFQTDSQSQALRNLFLRPWFHRVWVLQEVALATTALLFYGGFSINFSEVVQAALILSFRPELQSGYAVGPLIDAFQLIFSTYAKKNNWIQEKSLLRHIQSRTQQELKITFSEVLHVGRRFLASNPVDHIYAFLGHPIARAGLGSSGILEADYTLTIEEATRKLAERLYGRDHRLDFLCNVVHNSLSGLDDFPSWVPDFQSMRRGYINDHPAFNADNPERTGNLVNVIFADNKLQGLGVIFDTITACSETFSYQNLKSSSPHPIELCWHLQLKFSGTGNKEEQVKSLAWTISGGLYPDAEANLLRDFKSYCRKNFSPQTCATMQFQEFGSQFTNTASHDWETFEGNTLFSLFEKRFFITADGHFGLGSSALQVGDSCCVLLGCTTPLVIRPTAIEGHFKLRGACYIYGIMRGSVVEGVKSASDLTVITLV